VAKESKQVRSHVHIYKARDVKVQLLLLQGNLANPKVSPNWLGLQVRCGPWIIVRCNTASVAASSALWLCNVIIYLYLFRFPTFCGRPSADLDFNAWNAQHWARQHAARPSGYDERDEQPWNREKSKFSWRASRLLENQAIDSLANPLRSAGPRVLQSAKNSGKQRMPVNREH